jgi:hypothetical protein
MATSIHDPAKMFAKAMKIGNTVTDAHAICAACAKALKRGGYHQSTLMMMRWKMV